MKLNDLCSTNAEYDAEHWTNLRAMYAGGKAFRARLGEFLPQNPQEPFDVYSLRKKSANYENHVAPIIDYFVAWLFSMSFSVKALDKHTKVELPLPEFYADFHSEVGADNSLPDFIKERTSRALQVGLSYAVLEKAPLAPGEDEPQTLADHNARGLDKMCLKTIEREALLDWELGADGHYEWANVHSASHVRGNPLLPGSKRMILEQWRIYDRENVALFEIRYEKGQRPPGDQEIPPTSYLPHGFSCVPLLKFELPEGLRAGDRTYEPQLEHFRLNAGLAWSIRATCYAMPVINCADAEQSPPKMGVGYFLQLGEKDKFGWTAPPAAPYDVIQKNIGAKREEIYRINHSMAQALDNNAETVGRSADSKNADSAATRVVLNALGQEVCRFVEELYEVLSKNRGEKDIEWAIEGFSGYDTTTAGSLIGNAEAANRVGIPSKTFRKEISTKIAQALLPEADQSVKELIRKEIAEFDFVIVDPMSAPVAIGDSAAAKAELDRAKAEAEPIKAQAAVDSANRPAPAPSPNGARKSSAPQP